MQQLHLHYIWYGVLQKKQLINRVMNSVIITLTSGNFVKSLLWSCLQDASGWEEAFDEALEFYDKGFYE